MGEIWDGREQKNPRSSGIFPIYENQVSPKFHVIRYTVFLLQNTYRNAHKLHHYYCSFRSQIKYLQQSCMNIYNGSPIINIETVLSLMFYLLLTKSKTRS